MSSTPQGVEVRYLQAYLQQSAHILINTPSMPLIATALPARNT
ncbi:hypothetical protein [Pseudomonas putida]|nr:hypothetical protein [Pseudomonas putida]